jgi:hypothetical protein
MVDHLPENVQKLAAAAYPFFREDPFDPSLENEDLYKHRRGRHAPGSRSVAISRRYRAIYRTDNGIDGRSEVTAVWYWIGSHEDYNNFVGK